MRLITKRRLGIFLLGSVVLLGLLYPTWRKNADRGGQQPADPFRIAGNLYFVGANDVSAFLITGPDGHVLLDGGYPGTAAMIAKSIAALGFDIRDVKVLLNSDPHADHAGGLAALREASGAALWASEASAYSLASGGDDPDLLLPLRFLVRTGIIGYPSVQVDHRLTDGQTISVGPIRITVHLTKGHTRGCTSFSFPVQEAGRTLHVVSACSLVTLGALRYPEQRADLERTFRLLRSLPADIWVTSHGRLWGRYRKYAARDTATHPVDPFIDPAGYRAYVDSGESRLRRGVVQ